MSDSPSVGLFAKNREPDDDRPGRRRAAQPRPGNRTATAASCSRRPSVRRPRILAASLSELQQVEGIGPKLAAAIVEHRNPEPRIREIERCRWPTYTCCERARPTIPGCWPRFAIRRASFIAGDSWSRATKWRSPSLARGGAPFTVASRPNDLPRGSPGGSTVISGLARGIDAAAHRGAFEAGGRTIAVAATGLAQVYPPEHKELAAEIAEHGAVVCGVAPRPGTDRRPLSATQPDHQRHIAGRDHHRGDPQKRRTAHGPARDGAGTGSLRPPGTNRQPDERRLPRPHPRRRAPCARRRRRSGSAWPAPHARRTQPDGNRPLAAGADPERSRADDPQSRDGRAAA